MGGNMVQWVNTECVHRSVPSSPSLVLFAFDINFWVGRERFKSSLLLSVSLEQLHSPRPPPSFLLLSLRTLYRWRDGWVLIKSYKVSPFFSPSLIPPFTIVSPYSPFSSPKYANVFLCSITPWNTYPFNLFFFWLLSSLSFIPIIPLLFVVPSLLLPFLVEPKWSSKPFNVSVSLDPWLEWYFLSLFLGLMGKTIIITMKCDCELCFCVGCIYSSAHFVVLRGKSLCVTCIINQFNFLPIMTMRKTEGRFWERWCVSNLYSFQNVSFFFTLRHSFPFIIRFLVLFISITFSNEWVFIRMVMMITT